MWVKSGGLNSFRLAIRDLRKMRCRWELYIYNHPKLSTICDKKSAKSEFDMIRFKSS